MTGRWSLEFGWHCLARLCSPQRSPIGLTSVEALHAAHDRLLRCSVAALFECPQFLVDIGDGALLCTCEVGDKTNVLFAAAAQISRRRSCRRAGGTGRGVTGAVLIW